MQLGDRMKDVITGFVGVATGQVDYITGCKQFLLAPPVKDDGSKPGSEWFDEDRLEVVEARAVTLPRRVDGPDMPAPVR